MALLLVFFLLFVLRFGWGCFEGLRVLFSPPHWVVGGCYKDPGLLACPSGEQPFPPLWLLLVVHPKVSVLPLSVFEPVFYFGSTPVVLAVGRVIL